MRPHETSRRPGPDMLASRWRLEVHDSLDSTQELIRHRAEQGAPAGLAVQAVAQSGGRGRQGRSWISPPGNLYLSVLLRPSCAQRRWGELSFVAAIAVADSLEHSDLESAGSSSVSRGTNTSTGVRSGAGAGAGAGESPGGEERWDISLKWPNDIFLNGRKLCGILLESGSVTGGGDREQRQNWLSVGIGLNVNSPPRGCTSLREGKEGLQPEWLDVGAVRDRLLNSLAHWLEIWEEKGFAPVRQLWLKQAQGLGQRIEVDLHGRKYEGLFEGLDESGALLLRQEKGLRTISAGDIYVLE